MEIIDVPRPRSKRDPNRPASSLLLAQVKHLREAEKSLPQRYHSDIFSHAIQTEGEAANYVLAVTEAIHAAHDDAARAREARLKRAPKRKEVITIAARADETAERKARSRSKAKKKGGASGRKK
jgi:hypothetical protein